VIVGSVDGNRLWGKELGLQLCFVEWSPDGRNLLFGTLDHKVHIYDSAGNYISKMGLHTEDLIEIVGLEW
jgi:WD repeat-containing protein 35